MSRVSGQIPEAKKVRTPKTEGRGTRIELRYREGGPPAMVLPATELV